MAQLTTGIIENTAVSGVRTTTNFTVRISNDGSTVDTVLIKGFFISGSTKVQYVEELLSVAAGGVESRTYFAQFDAFEFQFITSSDFLKVSAWGKNASGVLSAAHRVVPEEGNRF